MEKDSENSKSLLCLFHFMAPAPRSHPIAKRQIYETLLCESHGAMWTQTLTVGHNKIKYSDIPLELPQFMGHQCYSTKSMRELLVDTKVKETIFSTAKRENEKQSRNEHHEINLSYSDFN
jgi:hypothetical protein